MYLLHTTTCHASKIRESHEKKKKENKIEGFYLSSTASETEMNINRLNNQQMRNKQMRKSKKAITI